MEEMMTFIGVKMISARPATVREAIEAGAGVSGKVQDAGMDQSGYLVVYPNGYRSWSPKDAFEKAYMKLSEQTLITEADIEAFMGEPTVRKLDPKTTLVSFETATGFVQHEASSCVSPENYDEQIGVQVATGRVKNKLWPCFGFLLQWARNGLSEQTEDAIPSYQQRVIDEHRELSDRMRKLNAFISDANRFNNLPSDERVRLTDQYDAMERYLEILSSRIMEFDLPL